MNAVAYHIPSRAEAASMKELPHDPMRVYNRFFAAFLDDLSDQWMKGGTGTPRADAVYALDRELRKRGERK